MGTSSVKCVLIDANGVTVAQRRAPYPTQFPQPRFAEQEPDHWVDAAFQCIKSITKAFPDLAKNIECIGLSGTAHTAVLLDASMKPIRAAILWKDQRSEEQVEYLEREHGDDIEKICLNRANCTWTLPQLLWLKTHEWEIYQKICFLMISKDYVLFKLTGVFATDFSSAVSTLLVDASSRTWSAKLLDIAGLSSSSLPPIMDSTDVVGTVQSSVARSLGLNDGVKVVVGSLDSAAELFGTGAIEPGTGMIRLGTAGGVMAVTAGPKPNPMLLAYPHIIQPLWYVQAATNSCGTAINWVKSLLVDQERIDEPFAVLEEWASRSPLGSNGVVFHPYLLGERVPYWDPSLKASFTNVSIGTERADFIRAVFEGIAFSLRDCYEYLRDHEYEMTQLKLAGGGAQSPLLVKIIADVIGCDIVALTEADSALGAAFVASYALGIQTDRNGVQTTQGAITKYPYDDGNSQAYSRIYQAYKDIQRSLAGIYHRYRD